MSQEIAKGADRILVVDDTKSDRELFKYLLGREGFDVETSSDGTLALEFLRKKPFDLVLCDYLMPHLDGYEFLLRVRQDPRFSNLVVIIITSDESDETKAKLLKGGANDFVHKGDSHDEIMARIRVHLIAQKAQADLKDLGLACELAEDLSQPVSVFIEALDVLKNKIHTEMPESKTHDFQELLRTLNQQADLIIAIVEDLKRLSMDAHQKYEFKE